MLPGYDKVLTGLPHRKGDPNMSAFVVGLSASIDPGLQQYLLAPSPQAGKFVKPLNRTLYTKTI